MHLEFRFQDFARYWEITFQELNTLEIFGLSVNPLFSM